MAYPIGGQFRKLARPIGRSGYVLANSTLLIRYTDGLSNSGAVQETGLANREGDWEVEERVDQ